MSKTLIYTSLLGLTYIASSPRICDVHGRLGMIIDIVHYHGSLQFRTREPVNNILGCSENFLLYAQSCEFTNSIFDHR